MKLLRTIAALGCSAAVADAGSSSRGTQANRNLPRRLPASSHRSNQKHTHKRELGVRDNLDECIAKNPEFIGDGLCDDLEGYNIEGCGWDGGDCCPSTCKMNHMNCSGPMACKDPNATENERPDVLRGETMDTAVDDEDSMDGAFSTLPAGHPPHTTPTTTEAAASSSTTTVDENTKPNGASEKRALGIAIIVIGVSFVAIACLLLLIYKRCSRDSKVQDFGSEKSSETEASTSSQKLRQLCGQMNFTTTRGQNNYDDSTAWPDARGEIGEPPMADDNSTLFSDGDTMFERVYNEKDDSVGIATIESHDDCMAGTAKASRDDTAVWSVDDNIIPERVYNEMDDSVGNDAIDSGGADAVETICDERFDRHATFEVHAPPGKLGIVFDNVEYSGHPVIQFIKESSCIRNEVEVGDELIKVNGENVRDRDAVEVSRLISGMKNKPRRLVFVRQPMV